MRQGRVRAVAAAEPSWPWLSSRVSPQLLSSRFEPRIDRPVVSAPSPVTDRDVAAAGESVSESLPAHAAFSGRARHEDSSQMGGAEPVLHAAHPPPSEDGSPNYTKRLF